MQLLDSLRRVVKQRPQHLLAVLAERWRGEVDPPLLGNFASEIFDKARQAEQDKKKFETEPARTKSAHGFRAGDT